MGKIAIFSIVALLLGSFAMNIFQYKDRKEFYERYHQETAESYEAEISAIFLIRDGAIKEAEKALWENVTRLAARMASCKGGSCPYKNSINRCLMRRVNRERLQGRFAPEHAYAYPSWKRYSAMKEVL